MKGLILFFHIFFISFSQAQTFFTKNIGGPKDDEAITVREAPGGGYYVVGNTRSKGNGGADVYLVKVNEVGNVEWEKTYGGSRDDFGWGMRVLKSGDVVITGFSDSDSHGKDDVLVIRVDSKGNEKWKKNFGGPYDDRSWDIIETSDRSVVVVGEYAKADNKTNLDGWLLKLDENGNEIWSKMFGWEKVDRCFSVVETPDKGFILSGFTNSKGMGDFDVYLVKANASGEEQWSKTFGGAGFDVGHTVRLMKDGYMIVGYSRSSKANGKADAYILQTDFKGNKRNEKSFGDDIEERTLTFVEYGKGYVLLGYAEITDENWDACIIEIDSQLNPVHTKRIGGSYLDTGGHNILNVANDVVFTGYITGNDKNIYVTRTNFK